MLDERELAINPIVTQSVQHNALVGHIQHIAVASKLLDPCSAASALCKEEDRC